MLKVVEQKSGNLTVLQMTVNKNRKSRQRGNLVFFVDGKIALETGATVETWRAASLQHPPSELKTGKHTALLILTSYT
jgi:hypothetical protein